jgi:hypothetical protein
MVFPIAGGNESKGYEVENSLRFNDDDSAYLTRTNSSGGSRQIFTTSFWFKRGNIFSGSGVKFFDAGTSTSTDTGRYFIAIDGSARLQVIGGATSYRTTSQVFRDPSAWYHAVVAVNTTNSVADNRIKIYVNGIQVTAFDTNNAITQNQNTPVNESSKAHQIGRNQPNTSEYYDGYIAEFHHIDGQQKAQTDFGEFDDNGVWIPKKYTGTYGTNGVFLEFQQTGTSQNSSGIGADTSGNDNHFAVNNFAATDVTEDTCTNNFATMNPLAVNASGTATFSEGNCQVATVVSGSMGGYCNIHFPSSGKWYCEAKITTSSPSNAYIGVVGYDASDSNTFTNGDSTFYYGNGQKYVNNSTSSYGTAWSQNDIIGMAVNVDDNEITFYLNGSSQGALSETLEDKTWNCGDTNGSISHTFQWNFGNPVHTISSGNTDGKYGNFEYAPPSGYYALCTKRLAEFG